MDIALSSLKGLLINENLLMVFPQGKMLEMQKFFHQDQLEIVNTNT